MDIIPLLYVRDNQLIGGDSISDKKVEHVYLMDLDGWFANQPNLELYQKLSYSSSLWIDSAPRRFEDVMDVVVAGAERITIREDTYRDDTKQIFDEIEIEKFIGISLSDSMNQPSEPWDGIVIYIPNQPNLQEEEQISLFASKFNVWLLLKENNFINIKWAEENGIKGIILPLEESV